MIQGNKALFDIFRHPQTIQALSRKIHQEALNLSQPLKIMEVCGGHTHTIMKYGLRQLLPQGIEFIHGPGCPVCVMPKERIDQAIALARMNDTILLTLGDMIRVPGSISSLVQERSLGCDIRPLYSPVDALKIARENPTKKVIFFAIGFETTTPMTAALILRADNEKLQNLFFHINHVLVPPAIGAIMDDSQNQIDAFIGPAHVSVITGAQIYESVAKKYGTPVVVSGFEPVDVMEGILKIIGQNNENRSDVEVQYSRAVTYDGNQRAQAMINKTMCVRENFRWRGLGDIAHSALKLRDEYAHLDAEAVFTQFLSYEPIDDHKLCICGSILKGLAKPNDCTVFGTACIPNSPLGSCMVSSEGSCNAYYRYGSAL